MVSTDHQYDTDQGLTVAFTGNGVFRTTVIRVNQLGKGMPSSRAKLQARLEAAAVELMAIPNDT